MRGFEYCVPTEVVFGVGTTDRVAELVKRHGGSRVLVIYGGGSAVRSGLLGRVCAQLEQAGITYAQLGGVQPNPRLALAREGVQKALAMGADFIVPVGGGSVIDTAKAVAIGAANPETDIWEYWMKKAVPERALPVGVVLTIPAAGSETSDSAVLTNAETGEKRGINTQLNRPAFAIMDPAVAATLPAFQVACGVTDVMMHTMDRYFNVYTDNETSDELAEALLRVVIRNGPLVVADPANTEAMSELMWCGSLSHNGLTGLGGIRDFSTHQLGHELSGRFDVAHGASLSVMWGPFARYVSPHALPRFARFARNVWGISEADDAKAAQAGIAATVEYFHSIGMPTNFTELGIGVQPAEVIEDLAYCCSFSNTRTICSFVKMDMQAMAEVYAAANL